MTFDEAQREIESSPMVIRLNVVSGLKTFLLAMQSENAVCDLRQMLGSKEKQELVLSRLVELSRQRIDRRYENPWDTALAIYLWLLSSAQKDLLALAAEIVAQAPQCWWAKKLSDQLLRERETQTKSSVQAFTVPSQPLLVSYSVIPDMAFALFPLETGLMSGTFNSPLQIHMPHFPPSLSRADNIIIHSGDAHQISYTNTAANQELAEAA